MKQKNKIFVFIYAIFLLNCSTNKGQKVLDGDIIIPEIDSTEYSKEECMPLTDSMNNLVWLVFEGGFNGRATVFLNDKLIEEKMLKTNENLGVCSESFLLRFEETNKRSPIIKISYQNHIVKFRTPIDRHIIYINFIIGIWSFEASRCIRQYR
jgi:hypothetical protein